MEYDIDKIVGGLSDKTVGNNANSIMGMLSEANKVLGEFQKTTTLLKNMGVFPLLVRAAGKKYGVDAETPLKSDAGIIPASQDHAVLLERINTLNGEQLLILARKLAEPFKPEPLK